MEEELSPARNNYEDEVPVTNRQIMEAINQLSLHVNNIEQRLQIIEGREQLDIQDRKKSFSSNKNRGLDKRDDESVGDDHDQFQSTFMSGSFTPTAKKSESSRSDVLTPEELKGFDSKKDKDSRRKSVFLRNVEESNKRAQTVVQINREIPSFSHIHLNSFDLVEYVTFIQEWFRYHAKHGIKLTVNQLVGENVKQVLMMNHDLTEGEFSDLEPERFLELMAKETQIQSKAHFHQVLSEALSKTKPMIWKTFVPSNHELFYQGILTRQKLFSDLFSIMMENNKHVCPSVSGKATGLAHLFLSMFDKDYTTAVLKELKPINETNYPKIDDFIKDFVKLSKDYHDVSRAISLIPYSHPFFADKSVEHKLKNGIFVPKSIYKQNKEYVRTHVKEPDKKFNNYGNRNSLNMVNTIEEEAIFVNLDDNPVVQEDLSIHLSLDSDDDNPVEDNPSDTSIELNANDEQTMLILNQVSAKPQGKVRGCWRYALFGDCSLGAKCANASGHSAQAAPATQQWMLERLTNQLKGNKVSPTAIMPRPKQN